MPCYCSGIFCHCGGKHMTESEKAAEKARERERAQQLAENRDRAMLNDHYRRERGWQYQSDSRYNGPY